MDYKGNSWQPYCGEVGFVIVGKSGVEFVSMIENLEDEVEVLWATDHWNDPFGRETLGLGFDRGSDNVGFKEGGVHSDKVVVQWVVVKGIHGGTNGGGGKTDIEDWVEKWTKEEGRLGKGFGVFKWNDPFTLHLNRLPGEHMRLCLIKVTSLKKCILYAIIKY